MKNQALVATLAIALIISLGAVAALFMSGHGTPADVATAVTVPPASAPVTAPALEVAEEAAVTNVPAAELVQITNTADPTDDADVADESTNDPDASPDAAEDAEASLGSSDASPGTAGTEHDADHGNDDDAAGDTGHDAGNDEDDAVDDTDHDDVDDGHDAGDTFECPGGELVDDICVVTPIHCLLGYDLIEGTCVFTGCPVDLQLIDDLCQEPVLALQCPDGARLIDGACIKVLEPGILVPFCPEGQHVVNNICVPDITNPDLIVPDVVIEGVDLGFNPDLIVPDVVIEGVDLGFNPDLAPELDLTPGR